MTYMENIKASPGKNDSTLCLSREKLLRKSRRSSESPALRNEVLNSLEVFVSHDVPHFFATLSIASMMRLCVPQRQRLSSMPLMIWARVTFGFLSIMAIGGHDHAGSAEAALQGIVLRERLLQRMKVAVRRQPLDGEDFLAAHVLYGKLAGAHRFLVDDHRASAAQAGAAAELGSGQSQVGAQDPEQHPVAFDFQFGRFAVEFKINGFFHRPSLSPQSSQTTTAYKQVTITPPNK